MENNDSGGAAGNTAKRHRLNDPRQESSVGDPLCAEQIIRSKEEKNVTACELQELSSFFLSLP